MFSTAETLLLLRAVNPEARITEDKVRHVLRRRCGPKPKIFSGRLVWTTDDVCALALALGLNAPTFSPDLRKGLAEVEHD